MNTMKTKDELPACPVATAVSARNVNFWFFVIWKPDHGDLMNCKETWMGSHKKYWPTVYVRWLMTGSLIDMIIENFLRESNMGWPISDERCCQSSMRLLISEITINLFWNDIHFIWLNILYYQSSFKGNIITVIECHTINSPYVKSYGGFIVL